MRLPIAAALAATLAAFAPAASAQPGVPGAGTGSGMQGSTDAPVDPVPFRR